MKVDQFFAFRNRGDESKPFLSHLEDLRFTIVKIAIALVLAMVACFLFRNELAAIVQRPLIAVDPQRLCAVIERRCAGHLERGGARPAPSGRSVRPGPDR